MVVPSEARAYPVSFPDGVERWEEDHGSGFVETGEQCARCGSSVTWQENDSIDLGLQRWATCLASEEWCNAHPLAGRDGVRGAGRATESRGTDG